jgi:hypothetical protein
MFHFPVPFCLLQVSMLLSSHGDGAAERCEVELNLLRLSSLHPSYIVCPVGESAVYLRTATLLRTSEP